MKNYLLIILMLGVGFLSSCEEDPIEETNPITFSFEKDGIEIDYSSNCYWFDHPDNGTPYYIAGWSSDSYNFKITVPELGINKWTESVNGDEIEIQLVTNGINYWSNNGETDYTLEITKYDVETGRVEGTFSATLGSYSWISDAMSYKTITNGVFIVDED